MKVLLQKTVMVLALSTVAMPSTSWSEEIAIVGTGDGIDILRELTSSYNSAAAEVQFTVPPSVGSGGGIAAVGSGTAVLGRIARGLTEAELTRGIVPTLIARMPSAIFVNRSAGITGLTAAQLRDIYAGKITNWQDVGGADQRIKVVRREEADSTLVVLRGSMPGWRDLEITERSKLATSTQETIETVRTVEGAVGFGPFTRTLEDTVIVLRIDGKYPTDSSYPSSAALALIHLRQTVTSGAKDFLLYAQSPEARNIISRLGAVPTF
jgi:phosphate transport system substrate-binding protein